MVRQMIKSACSFGVMLQIEMYDSWGPRLEDTLRNAVFATVERGGNLLSVMQLLGEKAYREQVVPLIRDPIVRSFWMHEFASWFDNYRTEAVAAIQNKLRLFLTSTNIRAIVTFQVGSDDAQRLAEQLGKHPGQITPENLTGLPKYTACVRLLLVNGGGRVAGR